MARKTVDWAMVVSEVNSLIQRLKRKPGYLTMGYAFSPGGILNAYREGDLTFNQAVKALNSWHRWKPQKRRRKRAS